MLKKYLLRLVCVLTLLSFTVPVYALNSPSDIVHPHNDLGGTGTLQDPWQISNCLDLASLANAKYASTTQNPMSFVLTNDIDCSDTINWNDGVGFYPPHAMLLYTQYDGVGTPPEQYFDGMNHTISGLYFNSDNPSGGSLLFTYIGFGATVKNLKIQNATYINTGSQSARHGILNAVNYGTIQNVQVNGNINAMGSAGLVSAVSYGTITQASSTGTITSQTGDSFSFGGLVGTSIALPAGFGLNSEISNSYSTANIISNGTSTNSKCGGLIGNTEALSNDGSVAPGAVLIKNNYANASIDCSKTGSYSGGLMGSIDQNDYSLQNNFASSTMTTGVGVTNAGLVGYNNTYSSFTNSFYDATTTGQSICSSPQTGACSAVNSGNTQPDYFKNNSTNAPLDSWDFTNTWAITSGLPVLKTSVNPPSAVLNLTATPGLTFVDLTWDAPTEPVGIAISDYEIIYRPSNTSTWETFSDDISNTTSTSVTGLLSGMEYEFRLRAINSGGPGLYSNSIFSTTTTAPGTSNVSFRGDGSVDNPWQISSCQELQDMNNPIYAYNLDAPDNFILMNDIDCSDTINWNSGQGFIPINYRTMGLIEYQSETPIHEQYFDGRNHTISGLYMNNTTGEMMALFEGVGELSTVKNLKMVNTTFVSSDESAGWIASIAAINYGTIANVTANVSISNTNATTTIGGVVAENSGLISRSSTSGSITQTIGSYNHIGGIVGQDYEGTIDNSFSSINISESGSETSANDCGGVAGRVGGTAHIDHSYATGTIYCVKIKRFENSNSGSFAGVADTNTISNSFGVGFTDNTSNGPSNGGFVGTTTANAVFPNSLYDQQRVGNWFCSYNAGNACLGKNLWFVDMNYFFNTSTNAPFNTWDFVNTWHTTSTYPLLNSVAISPDRTIDLVGSTTFTTADLTWSAPSDNGGSPITDYTVQFKKAVDSEWTTFNDGISTNTSNTITGLEQGVLYDYRVRAVNAIGNGIWSFARTEVQLTPTIESPASGEFEYGDTLDYQVSLINVTSSPIDSIDTSFASDSFNIENITSGGGNVGAAPTNSGTVSNGTNWSGLLEPNQELVFHVQGKVNASPNHTGKLNFTGDAISYQGSALDLGADSDGTIRAESASFLVKETATDFSIGTSLRETGLIDDGDSVHLTFSITNHGPKAGFFTNSSVFIFIPPSINITTIENDYLICSNVVTIGSDLTTGIYANLQGQVFTQCVGTGGKISNVDETITVDVTGQATRDLNAGDVIARSMFITAQDADTQSLSSAFSTPASPNVDLFATPSNNNVSRYIYTAVRPSSQTTTTTTTTTVPNNNGGNNGGGSGNNNGGSTSGNGNNATKTTTPRTPSSKDSITTNKPGSSKGGVVIKNNITQSTSSSTSKVATNSQDGTYEGLPEIKTFLEDTNKAIKDSDKKSLAASFKAKNDSPFELFWLAGGLIISLAAIGLRQTLIIRRATKKLKS